MPRIETDLSLLTFSRLEMLPAKWDLPEWREVRSGQRH